jgi:hypothetical protein
MPSIPFNLNDPAEKSEFDQLIERWIQTDETYQRTYLEELTEIEKRLNNEYQPEGFSQDHSGNLARRNDPQREQPIDEKMYVSIPRTRPNQEAVLGDFVSLRRILNVTGRSVKDRNKAKVIKARMKYIEDSYLIPETVYYPAMDNAFSKGLHWLGLDYNPRARGLKGKFEPFEANARDVLIDSNARGPFFKSARRIIQKLEFEVKDAKKKFKRYPLFDPDKVKGDMHYSQSYDDHRGVITEYVTIYKIQFMQIEETFFLYDEEQEDVVEISETEYNALSQEPETRDLVFEGPEEETYYSVLYHRNGNGAFSLEVVPNNMFTLVPLVNIQSDGRLYPIGDVYIYKNLQDLLDVLVTVFLENAKRANRGIAGVDLAAFDQFQKEIETAIDHGGAIPGLRSMHYGREINTAIATLVPWVIGWIQDSAMKHAASMGELPAKQIAKETVQTLISKDRQAHSRKDVTIRWALTQYAKLMVSMIKLFDDEPDFIEVRDAAVGSFDYIPINQTWSEDEYMVNLMEMANVPEPQTEEEAQQFNEIMMKLRREFEMNNQVEEFVVDGFTFPDRGITLTAMELSQMIEGSGLTMKQFFELYDPQPAEVTMYKVNHLHGEDVDLNIRYEISTDFKESEEFRMNLAAYLRGQGLYSGIDLLKDYGVEDAEEKYERAMNESQAMALVKEISADPQIFQAVIEFIESLKTPERGTNGQPQEAVREGQQ